MTWTKNLEIYEALWQEAVELGIFPLKDPFDGVEDDIHLAKMLNRLNPAPMDDDEKKYPSRARSDLNLRPDQGKTF